MKKLTLLLLAFAAFLIFKPSVSHAEDPISLFMNGKRLNAEVPPKLVGAGTTMVPIRIIAEGLGAEVLWNQSDKSVKVEQGALRLFMKVDQKQASANAKAVQLEEAPIIENNNTMIPVRFVAEQLGLEVKWDQLTSSVHLNKKATDAGTVPNKANSESGTSLTGDRPASTGDKSTVPPANGDKPPSEAGSIKPGSSEVYFVQVADDRITIKATAALKPNLFYLSGPDRLVIDLPDVVIGKALTGAGGTASGELSPQHPQITKIRYAMFSSDPNIARIVVDLKGNIDYNLIESKNPQEISVAIKTPTPPAAPLYKVVVDAGHGGKDSGAISTSGFNEKDFNLSVALAVYKLLSKESKIQTIMTRSDDTFIELDRRVEIANSQNADLFVSIHGNNIGKPSINGVETYYNREISVPLANALHNQILSATGFTNRNVRKADYRVIKYTTMPAVLCEVGYLSNKDNEAAMFDSNVQEKVAASIVAGIKEILQIK